jgi:tRNA A-37 threonylcarbamoyl transferase component Bud32
MSSIRVCSECGSPISKSSRDGFCPRCLIDLALKAEAETQVDLAPRNVVQNPPVGAVGNYELIEQIGQGGMGVVYKARQLSLNRIVALKLMLSGPWATEAEIKRFRSETTAAATLQHPNVVAIHEVGVHEGRHYFSMDYIAGRSLAEVINRTPLPAGRAARYVKIIAEAIHHAHQRGILHRDLKPANVLVDADDQPRVTDFGLAKHIQVDSSLTVSGDAMGTPSYMPPEQAAGKRSEIGPASDVYSLGAILYDLLTGRPPFRADTPLDTLRQVLDTEPAPPRVINRNVPRDLETICLKCLAKAPGQRYPSAQGLADDLGRFLKQEPIHARPVGWLDRGWRWSRRNPVVAAFCGTTALLLLMVAWAALAQREEALDSAKIAASLTARLVADELQPLRETVNELASNKELAQPIVRKDLDALKALLQATLDNHQARTPPWLRLQNWVIMTPESKLVLRWPDADQRNIQQRKERDYFTGATNLAGRDGIGSVYLSKAYQSLEDDLYKFSVSVAVRDPNSNLVGVAALMVSLTKFAREALGPRIPGPEFVLVSEWDPSQPGKESSFPLPSSQREVRIVFHPTFGTSNQVASISHPYLERMTDSRAADLLGDPFYRDPLARQHPKFGGWWLAGFASVPDTKLTVIYQTRDWVLNAVAIAGMIVGFLGLLSLVVWFANRHRRAQRVP